jgi:TDG/mug DNA glycosylase family protein
MASASGTSISAASARGRSTRRFSRPQINDFSRLPIDAPQLQRVCFNGQTAGKLAAWFQARGYETRLLPSSSPAYTLAFASKLERWRAALL